MNERMKTPVVIVTPTGTTINLERSDDGVELTLDYGEEAFASAGIVMDDTTTAALYLALGAFVVDPAGLIAEIVAALEGDSNDAEHDALASVAGFFGIAYDPDAAS